MAVTVTLKQDVWISGVKKLSGDNLSLDESLAAQLISENKATPPSGYNQYEGAPYASQQYVQQKLSRNGLKSDSSLGQISTRSFFPNAISGTNTTLQSRTNHFAAQNLDAIGIVIPNVYVSTTETGTGGVATIRASVEYNGVITQLTQGGNSTMTATDKTLVTTDLVTLPSVIPKGAKFQIRIWVSLASGFVVYTQNNGLAQNVAYFGDVLALGTSVPDQTGGGTITNASSGGAMFFPAVIFGQTSKPRYLILGDSKALGQGDTIDSSGDIGNFARTLGTVVSGYINCGIAGDRASYFVASNPLRLSLLQYVTDVICAYGTNDFSSSQGNRTSAQILADFNTIWTACKAAGVRVWQATIDPVATSTDSFATTANQTTNANNTNRVTVNTTLRTNAMVLYGTVLDGVIDLADVNESYRDSGVWQANGQASYFTADGLHSTRNGYLAVKKANIIASMSLRGN